MMWSGPHLQCSKPDEIRQILRNPDTNYQSTRRFVTTRTNHHPVSMWSMSVFSMFQTNITNFLCCFAKDAFCFRYGFIWKSFPWYFVHLGTQGPIARMRVWLILGCHRIVSNPLVPQMSIENWWFSYILYPHQPEFIKLRSFRFIFWCKTLHQTEGKTMNFLFISPGFHCWSGDAPCSEGRHVISSWKTWTRTSRIEKAGICAIVQDDTKTLNSEISCLSKRLTDGAKVANLGGRQTWTASWASVHERRDGIT